MSRQRLKTVLKIVVSLGLLFVLVRTVGFDETVAAIKNADGKYFLLALVIYCVTLFVRGYRWQLLLNAQDIHVPLMRLVYLYFVGSFFNIVLPSGFGGDVVKFYELSRDVEHEETDHFQARVASSVLADRVSGVVVLLLMGTAVVPFTVHLLEPATIVLISGLTLGSILGLTVLLNERLRMLLRTFVPGMTWLFARRGIKGLYVSLEGYTWPALMRVGAVSLIFNVLIIGMNVALGYAFRVDISVTYYVVFIPIISLLLVIPLSINGFGLREGGYVALFGQAGVPQHLAFSMSLGFGGAVIITGLIGGLLYMGRNMFVLGSGSRHEPASGVEEPL